MSQNDITFASRYNVSRETVERLRRYQDLVVRWNPKINLVARSTLETIWLRHIEDSAQVSVLIPVKAQSWADLGSGAGFPGLVGAILLNEVRPDVAVTLVESDKRKAAFLRNVAYEVDVEVNIYSERIESIDPLSSDFITARALSSLSNLLMYSARHLSQTGTALFMKGKSVMLEIEEAKQEWTFEHETIQSVTDEQAVILKITNIKRNS